MEERREGGKEGRKGGREKGNKERGGRTHYVRNLGNFQRSNMGMQEDTFL